MVSKPLQVRHLRQQLAAVGQYVQDLYSPIEEEYTKAPIIISDCFDAVLSVLDEFDRQLTKIDGRPSAVGGEMKLIPEWREEWRP